jgi:(S)-ureidoglycine aminohydrolase
MKKITGILCLFISTLLTAQMDSLLSGMYSWKEPAKQIQNNFLSEKLFEGKVHDMEWLQMNAISIGLSKTKIRMQVSANEEQLLIVRSGILRIQIKDSGWAIGPGSVVLLMPGEKYMLQNTASEACTYYEMKYRSKLPIDIVRGKTAGGSFVKDWSKIEFKPHDKGGIRNFYERPTAMCKRFEMHVTTLKEGIKSHDPHTHKAEEIVLVIDNKTEMQIRDKFYKGSEGSIYYLGSNVSHAIRNDGVGICTYFAFQFE